MCKDQSLQTFLDLTIQHNKFIAEKYKIMSKQKRLAIANSDVTNAEILMQEEIHKLHQVKT